ncbi:ADP-ribosylglycohydrolase family protein [Streptomyces sp. IMTB 2501]|uniref:ADP-ribosylglycohydrolase family protein n=1 Tax=Streptomyces sp. IMTB 2501 TaxID=1776340 RepID=UPI0009A24BC4|nr:ADP-ribosylglycohydrolase family protein [Streptomyces sp. IMTB 2501]
MASIARTPPVPAPEDATGLRERARGALLGPAAGDALGAPAENLRPSEIRARWGRITGYVTDHPRGTDDTEYAIFSVLLLTRHGSALTPARAEAARHEWIADGLRHRPGPGPLSAVHGGPSRPGHGRTPRPGGGREVGGRGQCFRGYGRRGR